MCNHTGPREYFTPSLLWETLSRLPVAFHCLFHGVCHLATFYVSTAVKVAAGVVAVIIRHPASYPRNQN